MSDQGEQDSYADDIDEDEILAGLSAEEIKLLQNEMDVIAPDERVPIGMRQSNSSLQPSVKAGSDEDSDPGDIDEDEILAGLSAEELKLLQNEMDVIAPDERVPVGMRQKDQTEKPPTGTFDHRSLVDYLYWEKESKRMLEEERVPAILLPSEKKMREEADQKQSEQDEDVEYIYEEVVEVVEDGAREGEVIEEVVEDIIEEMVEVDETNKQPVNTSLDETSVTPASNTEEKEDTSPEPSNLEEKEEPESLNEEENTEQASTESKYENWVPQKEERIISKLKIPKLALGGNVMKMTARPSGNDTNLESTLDKIRKNNPSITEINLNNIENIPKEMLLDYVNGLKKNKYVKTFSIANTGADENVGFSLANMLRENRSITTLNIESNFISGKGIIAIMRCLQFNETLTELRFHNQRHMLGHHAEMEISRLLKANNTLLKLGYHFEQPGPRMVVTNLLTRNLDRQRQVRKEEQKQQQLKEQQELMEIYENSLNLPPGLLEMLGGYLPPMELLSQLKQEDSIDTEEISPESSPPPQQLKPHHQHNPTNDPSSDPVNLFKDIHLKRTPKKRDPLFELNLAEEKKEAMTSFQLKKTQRHGDGGSGSGTMADERANLKDVIKTLKPVPRRRQPPKVDLTPRDELLNEIRQSNVAYLKSVPLPKVLESQETSLF
ncbi:LOW QUALITY PROTEIN: leiomodin-3 [Denticeps clupeoides]|uniref:LOW QUALITY PROTEIN: leiomodin-3 n=1 Tax=Denticeps clupeoides TaxID=299321 RepID=UPI0010A3EC2C|nr:LOW QUALITY PROTEIN: leiomodin-3 [Denticeps clupeoides]